MRYKINKSNLEKIPQFFQIQIITQTYSNYDHKKIQTHGPFSYEGRKSIPTAFNIKENHLVLLFIQWVWSIPARKASQPFQSITCSSLSLLPSSLLFSAYSSSDAPLNKSPTFLSLLLWVFDGGVWDFPLLIWQIKGNMISLLYKQKSAIIYFPLRGVENS